MELLGVLQNVKWEKLNFETPNVAPPDDGREWVQLSTGYYTLLETISPEWREQAIKAYDRLAKEYGPELISLTSFDEQLVLNLLSTVQDDTVNFVELGAGRGNMCLTVAGAVDFQLLPMQVKHYRCLTIEIDRMHHAWTAEHFKSQGINAEVVRGAVWDHDGCVKYTPTTNPAKHYGQRPSAMPEYRGSPDIEAGILPAYTIDTFLRDHGFEHVHIMHLDIQGDEGRVLGTAHCIVEDPTVDYLIVGTHHKAMNRSIRERLAKQYRVLLDIPLSAGLAPTSVGKVYISADGVMVLESLSLTEIEP